MKGSGLPRGAELLLSPKFYARRLTIFDRVFELLGIFTSAQTRGLTEQETMALKQRLLYLSALSTDPKSPTISEALHEPVTGTSVEIDPMSDGLEYDSVHAARCDGWRVVRFPDQRANLSDSDVDVLGFQFILAKMEQFDE